MAKEVVVLRFTWNELKAGFLNAWQARLRDVLQAADLLVLQLWALVPQEKRDQYISNKKSDTAPVLDLLPLGYSKVLGKGRLPEIPLVVRARYFSSLAEKKIKEAGGVTELVA